MDTIATRLKLFISTLLITDAEFADRCGISRSSLSLFLSGKNKKLSDIFITQIHEVYPELSINWLLFNEGEMLVKNSAEEIDNIEDLNKEKNENSEKTIFSSNENGEFPYNDTANSDYKNLTIDNMTFFNDMLSEFQLIKQNILQLINYHKKIEMLKEGRKVKHITVYYDDNTFETFTPELNP